MRIHVICGALFCLVFGLLIDVRSAQALVITEVMYDSPGTDTEREWIEIYNDDSQSYDISSLKLYEANVNHGIVPVMGGDNLASGEYAVIAAHAATFQSEYSSFSGILTDSSFSLANTGETFSIKNGDTVLVTATYDAAAGAAGDGNTLSFADGTWIATQPTPGAENTSEASHDTENTETNSGSSGSSSKKAPAKKDVDADPVYSLSVTTDPVVISGNSQTYVAALTVTEGSKISHIKSGIYAWSFGDGSDATYQDRQKVDHMYTSPGTYQIILEYYKSKLTLDLEKPYLTTKKKVIVTNPAVKLSGSVETGAITLAYPAGDEFDVSGWRLTSGQHTFVFPKNTILLPKMTYVFTPRQLGFRYDGGSIAFAYPSGEVFASAAADALETVYYPAVKKSAAASALVETAFASFDGSTHPTGLENTLLSASATSTKTHSELPFAVMGIFIVIVTAVLGAVIVIFSRGNYILSDETADAAASTSRSLLPEEEIMELDDD